MQLQGCLRKVAADHRRLKRVVGMASPLLDASKMQRIIVELCKRFPREGAPYPYYELGHKFVSNHLLFALGRDLKLSGREKKLLRGFIGARYSLRVLTRARAKAELGRSLAAADKLARLDGRGDELFVALHGEAQRLLSEHRAHFRAPSFSYAPFANDVFSNPLAVIVQRGLYFDNFAGFAGYMREFLHSRLK